MLRASEYGNIKTKRDIKLGQKGEPVTEYNAFAWVIIAGGKKRTSNYLMLNRSAEADHAELFSLDILGLKKDAYDVDNNINQRFKDQLGRNEEGWYETNIMRKQSSSVLPSNKTGSLGQLGSLLRKLRKYLKLLQKYNQIICDHNNKMALFNVS